MNIRKVVALLLVLLLINLLEFDSSFSIFFDSQEAETIILELPFKNGQDIRSRFVGGNGTADDPFQIANVTQLQDIGMELSAHYVLFNDVNASITEKWNDGRGFTPIAEDTIPGDGIFDGIPFTGSFDGRGYNITSLYINRSAENNQGLFGFVQSVGHISNITLINSKVIGSDNVGGIVGMNHGKVQNCNVTGTITGSYSVGGLTGGNNGIVENSRATINIYGNNYYVGGLVGENSGIMENCHVTSNVNGREDVGGLVGKNFGTVENSNATSNVNGDDSLGGLVGKNFGTVKNSNATSNVNGYRRVGGLIGENRDTVENSNATGNVTGIIYIGGFVGSNHGKIRNCKVKGIIRGNSTVGGFAGFNGDNIKDSYAIGDVYGIEGVGGFVGGEGAGGMASNSFFCINHTTVNGRNIVTPGGIYEDQYNDWFENNKELEIDNHLTKINGTNYYNIRNSSDMKKMLPFASSGSYRFKQTGNIDLSYEPNFFIPIFGGIYDGAGYSISNLNVPFFNNSRIGLFGFVSHGAIIVNISLINSNVLGERHVGGLIGYNYGTVLNCHVTGNVASKFNTVGGLIGLNLWTVENCSATGNVSCKYDNVGGLIGWNLMTVEKCSTTGNVSGERNIGGLVGWNSYMIKNSYSTSSVRGEGEIGGLVGNNTGTATNCYATGNIVGYENVGGLVGYNFKGIVENSFWDMETTGQSNSDGGMGKSTKDMMIKRTFIKGGWDFDNIWVMIDKNDYPFLRWEMTAEINTYDSDNDLVPDIYDDFSFDPHASIDTDGDGSPDKWNEGASELSMNTDLYIDAFPEDPAASLDSDGDGLPDEWNPRMNESDSTSDPPLELDIYPNDPYNKPPDEHSIKNPTEKDKQTWIWVSLAVVVVLFIVGFIAISVRSKRKPPENEEKDDIGRVEPDDKTLNLKRSR